MVVFLLCALCGLFGSLLFTIGATFLTAAWSAYCSNFLMCFFVLWLLQSLQTEDEE